MILTRDEPVPTGRYGAPGGHGVGLHDKITGSRIGDAPLPEALQKRLRFIATVRNALVHDHNTHRISDRSRFVKAYDESVAELAYLKTAAAKRQRAVGKERGCAIS